MGEFIISGLFLRLKRNSCMIVGIHFYGGNESNTIGLVRK